MHFFIEQLSKQDSAVLLVLSFSTIAMYGSSLTLPVGWVSLDVFVIGPLDYCAVI